MLKFERWLAQVDQRAGDAGKPLVSLCFAQSLDGCLTLRRGHPTALSGPETHRLTHELRAWHDAILVGCGTVLADNPRLTVRMDDGEDPQPVILDTHLRTPSEVRLIADHPRPAWIAASSNADPGRRAALESAGATVLPLPEDALGQINLRSLLGCLSARGVRRLMVEGGAGVITSFLRQELADLVCITIAPVLLGGLHSIEATLPGLPRIIEPIYETFGEDLVVWGRFR